MFQPNELTSMVERINEIAVDAGNAIMKVYQREDFDVKVKSDDSPVTEADLAAHQVITKALEDAFPDIPCLSEESAEISFKERASWERYFLIDPLDGTKEFIARNDDFTVNIALIENNKSILGVIYAPVLKTLYFATKSGAAFKQVIGQSKKQISVRPINQDTEISIVASRRHGLDAVEKMASNFDNYQLVNRGSSLKMCLIAEGKADFYPRLAPTSEWDTAASQIIVEEAGGQLVTLDFQPMKYNQKESLLNPHFFTLGDGKFDWKDQILMSD